MPSLDEQKELLVNCIWTWTTQSGVTGYKVTGPNGNSIFLPAAGYRKGKNLYYRGSSGYCWSGTLYDSSCYAYYLYFRNGDHYFNINYREYGHTVRPVCD